MVGDATASPVTSPVDHAMEAVKEAWALPEARASLVSALLKLEKLDEALGANGAPDAAQTRELNAGEQQMLKLEADRLKLLGEIDELKRFRQDKRDQLMDELRHTHSAEFKRNEQKNEQLLAAPVIDRQGCVTAGDFRLSWGTELTAEVEPIEITDGRMQKSYPGTLWRLLLTAGPSAHHVQEFLFQT